MVPLYHTGVAGVKTFFVRLKPSRNPPCPRVLKHGGLRRVTFCQKNMRANIERALAADAEHFTRQWGLRVAFFDYSLLRPENVVQGQDSRQRSVRSLL